MSIDFVPYSTSRTYQTFSNPRTGIAGAVDAIHAALLAASWTDVSLIKSAGTILYPFGAPFHSGGSAGSNMGAGSIDGVSFALWNGLLPAPVADHLALTGASSDASLIALAAAITTYSDVDAVLSGTVANTLELTAKTGGPTGNSISVLVSGAVGSASVMIGGGYIMTSESGSSDMTLWITAYSNVILTLFLNGQRVDYPLAWRTIYQIVAGGHGFAVFCLPADDAPPEAGDFFASQSYFACFSPQISTNVIGLSYAACAGQSAENRSLGNLLTVADSVVSTVASVTLLHGVTGDNPLETPTGQTILQPAYCCMRQSTGGEVRIIGTLYDCMIESNSYARGTQFVADGRNWAAISSEQGEPTLLGNAAYSTIWMATT